MLAQRTLKGLLLQFTFPLHPTVEDLFCGRSTSHFQTPPPNCWPFLPFGVRYLPLKSMMEIKIPNLMVQKTPRLTPCFSCNMVIFQILFATEWGWNVKQWSNPFATPEKRERTCGKRKRLKGQESRESKYKRCLSNTESLGDKCKHWCIYIYVIHVSAMYVHI